MLTKYGGDGIRLNSNARFLGDMLVCRINSATGNLTIILCVRTNYEHYISYFLIDGDMCNAYLMVGAVKSIYSPVILPTVPRRYFCFGTLLPVFFMSFWGTFRLMYARVHVILVRSIYKLF